MVQSSSAQVLHVFYALGGLAQHAAQQCNLGGRRGQLAFAGVLAPCLLHCNASALLQVCDQLDLLEAWHLACLIALRLCDQLDLLEARSC